MKPKFLNENPKIYLVAPSFGCVTEPYQTRLKASIERLKMEGADIIEGENIWKALGLSFTLVMLQKPPTYIIL